LDEKILRVGVQLIFLNGSQRLKLKHGESTHHSPPLTALVLMYLLDMYTTRALSFTTTTIASLHFSKETNPTTIPLWPLSQRGEATSNGQSLPHLKGINSNPRKRFQAQRRASDPMFSAGSIKKVNGRWANGLMVALFASWRHHSGWPYFSLSIASH
jgi:hypothetical protein